MDGGSRPPSIVVYDRSVPAGGPVGSSGRRRRRVFWLSLGLGAMLLLAVGTVWIGYTKLNGNLHADTLTDRLLGPDSSRPSQANNAQNILIIRSDSRSGANAA